MGTVGVQSSLEMQVLLLSAWLGSALCLPQAAHVSPQAPDLSAHPNPAHTFVAGFQQGAHPNAAHTALRPDCARFQGAFPCAPGDEVCALDYKTSGCSGRRREALMALEPTLETPIPTTSIMELVELTLSQQLTPMPLLTMELTSPTLLILSLQLFLAMLSNLTNRNKAVCK